MYDAVEDGRHIVTMDVPKSIKMDDLLKKKGNVCFNQTALLKRKRML
ncbi:hypothetical protein SCCGRSA3_00075 [Marine Group I thaumarchaeote SCGC RSA3]|uniref:Uncharacterized protein n=1 Tax=Marine Group I thaumarchaeote SCGC RSA3 TaxID=1503183 RepID=A0A087S5D6_9ARCH|nr:hypothetical protein SCCGRSA3_00075 [Marine Group I thaumarchaeote SCGC RSA3]